MEDPRIIEAINKALRDEYGIETTSDRPIYRVVWSNDQYEKRMSTHSPEGMEYLYPQLIEVPKYKQWAKDRYILERLSYVETEQGENAQMTVNKVSYEPIWSFVNNKLEYLPPRYEVCKIVIDAIHAAIYGDHSLAKYKDDNAGSLEETQQRVSKLQDELFGNETDTGDAMAHGEAIVVPRNFESDKKEQVH
jgi:hypothetical protein